MRRTATTLLTGLLLVLVSWLGAPPATACSCAGASTAEQVRRADTIFTGRLLSREVTGGSSSTDPALHVFAVASLWKGNARAEQGVVSASSGASCGLELSGDGLFVVFATRSGGAPDAPLSADLCGGSAPWTPQLDSQLAELVGTVAPAPPLPGAAGTRLPDNRPWGWVLLGATGALTVGLLGRLVARRRTSHPPPR